MTPTEHQEQAAYFDWLRLQHPAMYECAFAVPNGSVLGGKNRFALVKKLKKEGMKNGVPDVVILYPTARHHGLLIEMKRKTMRPSDIKADQHAWAERLVAAGYAHCFCAGCESAITATKAYLEAA